MSKNLREEIVDDLESSISYYLKCWFRSILRVMALDIGFSEYSGKELKENKNKISKNAKFFSVKILWDKNIDSLEDRGFITDELCILSSNKENARRIAISWSCKELIYKNDNDDKNRYIISSINICKEAKEDFFDGLVVGTKKILVGEDLIHK